MQNKWSVKNVWFGSLGTFNCFSYRSSSFRSKTLAPDWRGTWWDDNQFQKATKKNKEDPAKIDDNSSANAEDINVAKEDSTKADKENS